MREPPDATLAASLSWTDTVAEMTPPKAKRDSIRVAFSAALIQSLAFERWPVSPVTWDGKNLVTEPTPAHIRDWVIRDAKTPGFGVRVTHGSKSYFVQRKRKGSTSDRWVLTEQNSFQAARVQAEQWYAAMGRVEDPRQVLTERAQAVADFRTSKALTFERVYAQFVAHGEDRVLHRLLRPSSLKDRKVVGTWLAGSKLGEIPLAEVTEELAEKIFAPLFAKAVAAMQARRLQVLPQKGEGRAVSGVAVVHKRLTYCASAWNLTKGTKAETNPFSTWRNRYRKKLPKVKRRQSTLPVSSDQGVAWLKALQALRSAPDPALAVTADYVLIAVLWGGRKTETALIRWIDVDFEAKAVCFAAETTKGNKDHYVPLTAWAQEILEQRREKNQAAGWGIRPTDPVFFYPDTRSHRIEDYRNVTRLLREQTGLWIRLHDLRRTLAGAVFGSVKNLGTVALALGHQSGQEVTADYIERQEALNALRDLYAPRERKLRQLMGLEASPAPDTLTDHQRSIMEAIKAMAQQSGLAPEAWATWLADQSEKDRGATRLA